MSLENIDFGFPLTLALWIAIAAISYWLLFRALRMLAGRTRTEIDNIVLRTVRVPLFMAIVAYGLVSTLDTLRLDPSASDLIHRLYIVVLIIAGSYLSWRIIREVVLQWLAAHADETESKLDNVLLPLLNTL